MKKTLLFYIVCLIHSFTFSQNLIKLHNLADVNAANALSNIEDGSIIYVDSDQKVYYFNGTIWKNFPIDFSLANFTGEFHLINNLAVTPTLSNVDTVQNNTLNYSDHFVFGADSLDNSIPNTSQEKFMFDIWRGAFRAGMVNTTDWNTRAIGSVALGINGEAFDRLGVSMGINNRAGRSDICVGRNNRVQDPNSSFVSTNGTSCAFGESLVVSPFYQTVFGHFNEILTVPTNPLWDWNLEFIIGNGTSESNRSNALELRRDGDCTVYGTWSAPAFNSLSDIRLKSNIKDLHLGRDFVKKLNPKSYSMMKKDSDDRTHYGLIAQDLQKINKHLVNGNDNESEYLSINYIEIIPILINTLKELQAELDLIKKINK